jgi:hypothetical protein
MSIVLSIFFVDPSHGWAVGGGGEICVSTDGGFTWQPQQSGTSGALWSVAFADTNRGWALGYTDVDGYGVCGNVLKTTDGGASWTSDEASFDTGFRRVVAVGENNAWAVGTGGTILHYTGGLWSPEPRPIPHPLSLSLSSYPNPFNPTTILSFNVPTQTKVDLSVYDLTGRLVETLTDRIYEQGQHRLTFNASSLASGIYFVRLQTPTLSKTQKLVLLK